MSTFSKPYATSLSLMYLLFESVSASPIPSTLQKRKLSSAATAGLGIAIAVLVIAIIVGVTFFMVARRRKAHNDSINRERAVLAGEKNADGTDKVDKFTPEPQISAMPRRNKSVKDRLMGPLYRGSMIELPPVPPRAKIGGASNRQSTMTVGDGDSFLNKPWAASGENSPRPSFSSKRATRMMMMM